MPHIKNAINTRVEVINDTKGRINLEGVESYGLKLSSRILEQSLNGTKSVFETEVLYQLVEVEELLFRLV